MINSLPTFFVSHGGGPWPWIDEMRPMFARSEQWLRQLPQTLPVVPKAVLSVSGHWEAAEFTLGTALRPPMFYDYYGFPPHTYQIRYPAPGSTAVAARVQELLTAADIRVATDPQRGFDHGTFVPLALMYPDASMPIVQLSLKKTLDPEEHLRMGAALQPLRDEGVLIVGSGLSYHNLREFRGSGGPTSRLFEEWLTNVVTDADPSVRNDRLINWTQAPGARSAHPREDHLIPLMVAAGAAGNDAGHRDLLDNAMGIAMASYRFGG